MPTQLDLRQSVLRAALGMVGSVANDSADTILPKIDAELAKHFEDRNILITDGGTITFTGTQLQFTENLNIVLNQKISGAAPQVISLGSSNVNFSATGRMWYAVIDRTAGTAANTTDSTTLPAATSANQEVFLIAKRVDAGDGTQRVYFRNGMALNAGQSVRLGASGSGSGGSGTGDDLDALLFRASFNDSFSESPTNANSSINSTGTNAVFNAAKALYAINYDASKTVTGTGVNMTLSGTPAYTVAVGDVLIVGGVARKITTVTSQTVYVIEAAFPTNPTAAQATVSQAVYTKDIYNLAVDGSALSAAFGGATFSEIMVDYKDNATSASSVWTPNTTPFVAFSASPDNSTFTSVGTRATNETDTAGSTVLPSAGTSLYLRFFSNKTSGSGFVNLLTYKAFMQKATAAGPSAGIINASYALSNGAGTPVNCSVSTVGGKTQIALTFQYAVGVNPGLPYGSVDVLVNGQMVPRFISTANNASGAYYTEVSGSVIQLDSDYSATASDIIVLQRTQIVDNSSANSTAIAALQDASSQGFQGFINNTSFLLTATTATGTPAAGTFYSSVQNRAPLIDMSQDLKPRMGIERIPVQQIYQLQNEFGPNGEPVWGVLNDTNGLIRFVGSPVNTVDSHGAQVVLNVGDYSEFTFYGTGLSLLQGTSSAARDMRVTVDGGAEGGNIYTATADVLDARNYATNQVYNLASGLSLGIHTIKLRCVSSNLRLNGFEILNESSSVKVNPGVSYIGGQKLVLAAQSAFSYSAPATGTRGGRVLVYQKSDGTIGQAFQAVNGASAFMSSADHTNEEMVRTYNWREFGAGRSDDFSLGQTTGNYAFTLDDGTTTLAGSQTSNNRTDSSNGVIINAVSGFITFTFTGTGMDLIMVPFGTAGAAADNHNVLVDGTLVGTLSVNNFITQKIASGLPYGTHTVKILRTVSSVGTFSFMGFRVYQPKKPALPSGAVELADYNVLANYVANTLNDCNALSSGVLAKVSMREFLYVGTGWQAPAVNPSSAFLSGFQMQSQTVGDYYQYTFFGTGVVVGQFIGSTLNQNFSVTIDGALNASGVNVVGCTNSGGGNYVNNGQSTAVRVAFTGLTLGVHTIKVTLLAGGTPNMLPSDLQIITPIHSAKSNIYADIQNTLPVGSCGISDNRKTTAVKDVLPATKAWAQASGLGSTQSITATSQVPMLDMSTTIKTTGGRLKLSFSGAAYCNTSNNDLLFQFYVDGVAVGQEMKSQQNTASTFTPISMFYTIQASPGAHKVDVYWRVPSGVTSILNASRTLLVEEL